MCAALSILPHCPRALAEQASSWNIAMGPGIADHGSSLGNDSGDGSVRQPEGKESLLLSVQRFYETIGDDYTNVELLFARNTASLALEDATGAGHRAVNVQSWHLQVGGNYQFHSSYAISPYLGATAGVSKLQAKGFSGVTRPSLAFGAGLELPLASRISLRLDLRSYAVLLRSDARVFCAGGCVVTVHGNLWWEYTASALLAYRF